MINAVVWMRVGELLQIAIALAGILVAITILMGCQPARSSQPECDPHGGYEAMLVACTEISNSLAESIACENKVRARCGRPLRDAGAD